MDTKRVIATQDDILMRRIKLMKRAKGALAQRAELLLVEAMALVPEASRTKEHRRALDELTCPDDGGRPRDDQLAEIMCRVFEAVRPKMKSDAATYRWMAALQWPIWHGEPDASPHRYRLLDCKPDAMRRMATVAWWPAWCTAGPKPPARYRTLMYDNIKRIVKKRPEMGTKPP